MGQGEIATEGSTTPVLPHDDAGDALMQKLDGVIEAKVQQRIGEIQPAAGSERIRYGLGLALGSMGIGLMVTGATASLLAGPGAVLALAIEWAAIAAINVGYIVSWRGPGFAGAGQMQVPPPVSPPALPPQAAPPPPNPRDPLGRLPLAVLVKVEQIRRKAEVLLEHQGQFPIGSKNLFVLRRTQLEYLPSTLDAYLALSGDDRPVAPDGRTGLQVLRDQLDLLDTKLDEIADDLQRANVDRLLANERFLEEHFGRKAAT
jgi:hypothetical protein